jgi:hypothetical protein
MERLDVVSLVNCVCACHLCVLHVMFHPLRALLKPRAADKRSSSSATCCKLWQSVFACRACCSAKKIVLSHQMQLVSVF